MGLIGDLTIFLNEKNIDKIRKKYKFTFKGKYKGTPAQGWGRGLANVCQKIYCGFFGDLLKTERFDMYYQRMVFYVLYVKYLEKHGN